MWEMAFTASLIIACGSFLIVGVVEEAAGGMGRVAVVGGRGMDMKRLLDNRSPATAQKVHEDYRWFGGDA